jgi:hypothetical protein
MVKLERVSNKGRKLCKILKKNYWRHKHPLYQIFSKVFENHFPKVHKLIVL